MQTKSDPNWLAQWDAYKDANLLPYGWGGRYKWCVGLYRFDELYWLFLYRLVLYGMLLYRLG